MKTNWIVILLAITLLGGGVWYFVFRKKKDATAEDLPVLPGTPKPDKSTPKTQTQLPKLSIREQNQQNLAKWVRLAVTYKKKSSTDTQGDVYLTKAMTEYQKLNYVQPLSEVRMAYYNMYKADMVADMKNAKHLRTTTTAYAFLKKHRRVSDGQKTDKTRNKSYKITFRFAKTPPFGTVNTAYRR